MFLIHAFYCFYDPQEMVLLMAFKECHRFFMRCTNQPLHSEPVDAYMCKHIFHHRPYKVSQEPVSIHLPISRLLAGKENQSQISVFVLFVSKCCSCIFFPSVLLYLCLCCLCLSVLVVFLLFLFFPSVLFCNYGI